MALSMKYRILDALPKHFDVEYTYGAMGIGRDARLIDRRINQVVALAVEDFCLHIRWLSPYTKTPIPFWAIYETDLPKTLKDSALWC